VTTWTLCTIPHAIPALEEMRRVLRPGGQLLFVEHGLAPEESVRKWQNRLTPFWRPIAGGCRLNRPISNLIETAGFSITALENSYVPKAPRMMGYLYQGRASP
ncbi:MAG: class I SAM-dependent methyltransferase, partial [Mesorhizobium sp.]